MNIKLFSLRIHYWLGWSDEEKYIIIPDIRMERLKEEMDDERFHNVSKQILKEFFKEEYLRGIEEDLGISLDSATEIADSGPYLAFAFPIKVHGGSTTTILLCGDPYPYLREELKGEEYHDYNYRDYLPPIPKKYLVEVEV